jgi:hypothetical protein
VQPNPRKRPHTARAVILAFDEIKKMDATQKAAVSQMTGSFNALNAGVDKTEARKLLGKKPPRAEAEVPFFQSVPFMIFSLIAIIALVVFMAMPPSTEKIMEQSRQMLASNDEDQWSEARIKLKKVMDGSGPFSAEAEELYFESRRQSLVQQAERGVSNRLQSENVKLFGKAVRLQQDGRNDEAGVLFQQLVDSVSPAGDDRHIHVESKHRLEMLRSELQIPADPGQLAQFIESLALANNPEELGIAKKALTQIMLRFAGETGYEGIVDQAKTNLQEINKRLSDETNGSNKM